MKRGLFLSVIFLGISSSALAVSRVPTREPLKEEGLWLVEDHEGIFYIGPCPLSEVVPAGQEGKMQLCGWLVGMDYTESTPPKDIWGRSECGALLITGMSLTENNYWHGHVLDPRSGHLYEANLWLTEEGTLKLRGYIGIFLLGKTETWTRYHGPAIGEACRMKNLIVPS